MNLLGLQALTRQRQEMKNTQNDQLVLQNKKECKKAEEISANTDPLLHFGEGYALVSFGKCWRRKCKSRTKK